jgi:hypothetical protein
MITDNHKETLSLNFKWHVNAQHNISYDSYGSDKFLFLRNISNFPRF